MAKQKKPVTIDHMGDSNTMPDVYSQSCIASVMAASVEHLL